MAGKKPINKKNQKTPTGSQAIVIFWLVFVIIIISIFMANAKTIQKNFNLFKTQITADGAPLPSEEIPTEDEQPAEPVQQQPETPPRTTPAQETQPSAVTETTPSRTEPTNTQTPEPAKPAAERPQPSAQPQTETPRPQPAQTRDRNIYFTQIDKDGQIFHSQVTRKIPVSQSPMVDALNVLLAGPSSAEINRGLLNLIPQNTRILSAVVRGSTAYINFSEDFLFNTFGVEGYAAQLRQIVWTVTEFSNVRDVQILVEGRRLDYIGEGIWIGSPISRQSF